MENKTNKWEKEKLCCVWLKQNKIINKQKCEGKEPSV